MVLCVISIPLDTKQVTNSEWKFKNKRKISSLIILSSMHLGSDPSAASRLSSVVIGTQGIHCDYQFLLQFRTVSYHLLCSQLQVPKKTKSPKLHDWLKGWRMNSNHSLYLLFGTECALHQFPQFLSQITKSKWSSMHFKILFFLNKDHSYGAYWKTGNTFFTLCCCTSLLSVVIVLVWFDCLGTIHMLISLDLFFNIFIRLFLSPFYQQFQSSLYL